MLEEAPQTLYESLQKWQSSISPLQLSSLGQKTKLHPHFTISLECRFSLEQNHIWQRRVSPIHVKPPRHRHVSHFRQLARLTKHLLLNGSFPKSRNRSLSTIKACQGVPSDGFIAWLQRAIRIPALSLSPGAATARRQARCHVPFSGQTCR